MKAIRACLLASFIAVAAPASAAPIAIGEFAFTEDFEFPDFFQWFSIANFLAPGHALADLAWGASVVITGFDSSEASLSLFDTSGDGLLGAGESAQTFSDGYLGSVESARLDFGSLVGFSAGVLTLDQGFTDPVTIFYDPEIASVPEPGTLLLIGSGLAFAALRGRRRHS